MYLELCLHFCMLLGHTLISSLQLATFMFLKLTSCQTHPVTAGLLTAVLHANVQQDQSSASTARASGFSNPLL